MASQHHSCQRKHGGHHHRHKRRKHAPIVSGPLDQIKDGGKRDMHAKLENILDTNYPFWQTKDEPKCLPPAFEIRDSDRAGNEAGQLAEYHMYKLLNDFGRYYKENMFIIHSYSFAERIKRTGQGPPLRLLHGECDFVIIHRFCGLIFIQVKASRNPNNLRAFNKAVYQLNKDRDALKEFLSSKECPNVLKETASGMIFKRQGVIALPNCPRIHNISADMIPCFKEDCRDIQSFKLWWDKNITEIEGEKMDSNVFKELIIRFSGISLCRNLSTEIDEVDDTLQLVLTPQQLNCYSKLSKEHYITGPAGSGKTVMLNLKVDDVVREVREHNRCEHTLILCYNVPLSKKFVQDYKRAGLCAFCGRDYVTVMPFDHLISHINKTTDQESDHEQYQNEKSVDDAITRLKRKAKSNVKYHHIFVDEAQELYGMWLVLIRQLQIPLVDEYGDSYNFLWIFYDDSHLSSSDVNPTIKMLNRSATDLQMVVRSTNNIFNLSSKHYKGYKQKMMGISHQILGPEVVWDCSLKKGCAHREICQKIITHLNNLDGSGVKRKDICLLVSNVEIRDWLLEDLQRKHVRCMPADEHIERQAGDDTAIVETVKRFNGLESKVVILLDPTHVTTDNVDTDFVLYNAFTRSRCHLIIITDDEGKEQMNTNSTSCSNSDHHKQIGTPSSSK
ncbi:uncharacterized protein LOC100372557 [Saccoglossus kowalevskii]|uniref:Uncharacterized protein LOC100372557 n=1 Tax=Saccoglossus kowalevskii TaxID=10224 RepID=A0ABM0GIT5_SACKO|nr:PREDICTED: uncharacterized protein LOC100372557 [Saccoglossus kowalevskii]